MAVRGSTPDYVLLLNDIDLSGQTVYVTISQMGKSLTLTNDRLSVAMDEHGTAIAFKLTQEDTLRFRVGSAEVQLKSIDETGHVTPTYIAKISIEPALLEKVIAYVPND